MLLGPAQSFNHPWGLHGLLHPSDFHVFQRRLYPFQLSEFFNQKFGTRVNRELDGLHYVKIWSTQRSIQKVDTLRPGRCESIIYYDSFSCSAEQMLGSPELLADDIRNFAQIVKSKDERLRSVS